MPCSIHVGFSEYSQNYVPLKFLQTQASCLPVSALHTLRVGEYRILFAGAGPHFEVLGQDGRRLLFSQVFKAQALHGIRTHGDVLMVSNNHVLNILFWGGKLVRLGRLTISNDEAMRLHLQLSNEVDVGDWILDAVFDDSSIFMLTAHNVLMTFIMAIDAHKLNIDRNDFRRIRGPGSFLYSGDLRVADSNLLIVAAGTVFGEILVWTCSRKDSDQPEWNTSAKHAFTGHKGSVFGVAISPKIVLGDRPTRLLASCSDDRTVRVWDIGDHGKLSSEPEGRIISTETGFGTVSNGEKSEVASAWGHASRIWGVHFVPLMENMGNPKILLLSRGEDTVCQLWSLELTPEEGMKLLPLSSDRYHSGKNAWSMCLGTDDRGSVVFTGGADGQIVSRQLTLLNATKHHPPKLSTPAKELTGSSKALKQYLPFRESMCFASTDAGDVYSIIIESGELKCTHLYNSPTRCSIMMCRADTLGVALVAQQRDGLFALTADKDSLLLPISLPNKLSIVWLQVACTHRRHAGPTCVVAALVNNEAMIIWLEREGSSFRGQHTPLQLPESFVVAACCYYEPGETLLLGSRAGALAVYTSVTTNSSIAEASLCLRHAHGTDCVSSIRVFEAPSWDVASTNEVYFLTTGRDGTYAVHRLILPQGAFSTVHVSKPPIGPYIDGSYLLPSEELLGTRSHDLMLYGFRSTSFIVWNETRQSTFLSVECGGAHRSWAYYDPILSNSVMPQQDGIQANVGTASFIWHQAGRFNWHMRHGRDHTVIRTGGHGREIKAVTRSPKLVQGGALIATGAEDTNIQLFLVSVRQKTPTASLTAQEGIIRPDNALDNTAFRSIATLRGHNTGLQHLLFAPSGDYLFSSAGREEFLVWKLTLDVPCIEVGTILWDVMPKEDEDSDARIMDFDLRFKSTEKGVGQTRKSSDQAYILTLAYSNGKSKVLEYTPAVACNQGTFVTLHEIHYGSFCILQASLLSSPLQIISAGTNGFLNLNQLDFLLGSGFDGGTQVAQSINTTRLHQIHQSSILSMDIIALDTATSFIATGGDDNALAFTLLSNIHPSTRGNDATGKATLEDRDFRTIVIPRAHAAALTALKIVNISGTARLYTVNIISAGNDQRVKAWKVQIDLSKTDSTPMSGRPPTTTSQYDRLCEVMQVQRLSSAWTSVADVSSVEVVYQYGIEQENMDSFTMGEMPRSGSKCEIIVVGVGMDLLSITW
ncbi:uncharacterized protein PV06_06212 [Exophiala oligosperma]|uniref:Uncharacterized protein n=1 Tax=Exophiala oligosperma TaxID=215243 RepID=A0A0D2E4G0_9EURO|nr:uncharacterized protein PV06_06212 [Exophiala oligosperma]KIW42689.1 hypothetical protein PV06_06212 [Exophiala oligosperma]